MKEIKMGIIGPADSLEIIKNIVEDFNNNASIYFKPYQNFEELSDIRKFCEENFLDVLLFSGQAPYYWVKERENIEIPMLYIPRNGTCLYRTLFNIQLDKVDFDKVSANGSDELIPLLIEVGRELNLPDIRVDSNMNGSDDATYFIKRVQEKGGKAIYSQILCPITAPHHNNYFDFDEKALLYGVLINLKITKKLLK